MRWRVWDFGKDSEGAVAPTVAISLFALIAAGGIAFDYARMASLDTELQNAADQATLAAATQLDGEAGTCARAAAAARNFVQNDARFANDGEGIDVTIPSEPACDAIGQIKFYVDEGKTDDAVTDDEANFVEVTVDSRTAFFALTPIVASLRSQELTATAFAGMRSAICKVPPLMMCNPDEPVGNANDEYDFDLTGRIGAGIRLTGGGSYAPGNFGFLETGFGNGANDLLKAMGYNAPPGDCLAIDGVESKTGVNASVMDGLNTRFDMPGSNSCPGGGPCSPSMNVRKDLVRSADACNWDEPDGNATEQDSATPPRYRPTSAALLPSTTTPQIMGHPRDVCHAWSETGNCTGGGGGRIGNAEWDRGAYFRSNHGGLDYTSVAGLDANGDGSVSRYEVYIWELGDPATRLGPTGPGTKKAYGTPVAGLCLAPGMAPGGTNPDRRRISAAVINCDAENVTGHEADLKVVKWLDLFIVEPSIERKKCQGGSGCNTKYTDKTDLYVELIGETEVGAVESVAGQVTRRDVPYLIE